MEQSETIKDIYRRSYEMYTSGAAATTARFVSQHPGTLIVGTDSEEWFEGAAQIAAVIPTYAPVLAGAGITIRPGDARAYVEGSVGWVVDTLAFTRDGRDYPCRATTILHQEEGNWKIVHQHFSFGVPNDEAEVFKGVTGAL
jgi:ketosteroid isomerase-like protein